jgi:hypothetical protein
MWPAIRPDQGVERLYDWRLQPDSDGDLVRFGVNLDTPPNCGTVARFGGWCEWYAPFRAQAGLESNKGEFGIGDLHDLFGTQFDATSEELYIFSVRYWGFPSDTGFVGTDRELVSNRLRWLACLRW